MARPTVLVVGAGVSAEYGFPLGSGLVHAICAQISGIPQRLERANFERGWIESLLRALPESGAMSVDAFLEHRPDLRAVGKAAIAAAIIDYERQSRSKLFALEKLYPYRYLLSRLKGRVDHLKNGVLSIISFNYDRSLEFYLVRALSRQHNTTEEAAAKALLAAIPIVHVHGTLGPLPSVDTAWNLEYGPSEVVGTDLRRASEQIVVVSEGSEDTPQFVRARALIAAAETVIFLGFGYDTTNLRRLGAPTSFEGKNLIGSAFRLTAAEQALAAGAIGHSINLGNPFSGSVDFLREHVDKLEF